MLRTCTTDPRQAKIVVYAVDGQLERFIDVRKTIRRHGHHRIPDQSDHGRGNSRSLKICSRQALEAAASRSAVGSSEGFPWKLKVMFQTWA